jgi:hypothetical protein
MAVVKKGGYQRSGLASASFQRRGVALCSGESSVAESLLHRREGKNVG